MAFERPGGRSADELRSVSFEPGVAPAASGSVYVKMGNTWVICAAMVEDRIPPWMRFQNVEGGWVTAEYSMLPYASSDRHRREAASGKVGGRTQEIQRLIGRSLRAVIDLKKLGPRTIWIDCDVVRADGGTRTASITGGFVALRLAVNQLLKDGKLEEDPITDTVAAVSVGLIDGEALLDLCYEEDFKADVDMNVVMTGSGKFIEVQGTAESAPFSPSELQSLLDCASGGIGQLIELQQSAFE